jgi:beta-aspartyl-peptidase (threonine type)
MAGGTALDAVEMAVRVLEDDPAFDAGTGAPLNRDGDVECDAAIADGATLSAGAVASLRAIKNPISVARRLLESEAGLMLAGDGALRFAVENGFERVPNESLVVPRELTRWRKNRALRDETAGGVFGGDSPVPLGTVGAVALDREGHVAAATSTGGTPDKHPGRIGDTPLIGCGTYADDLAGAISCTGWGESIIRLVLARRAAELIERGEPAQAAAETALALLRARVGGLAGMIVVAGPQTAARGPLGIAFNTARMARGAWVEGGEPWTAVHPS